MRFSPLATPPELTIAEELASGGGGKGCESRRDVISVKKV
jgi:hypothetical protein